MCFIPRKKLNKIETDLAELTKIVKTQELTRLRKIKDDYNVQSELLKDIRFKVKTIKSVVNENTGLPELRIAYEVPVVCLEFDEEGKPIKNNFFYASNFLELISIEDMEKIQREIEKTQKANWTERT